MAATPAAAHKLGDLVFCDNNSNGIYEPNLGETGIAGVTVSRTCDGGNGTLSTTTDGNGRYWLSTTGPVLNCTVTVDTTSAPVVGKTLTTPLLGVRPTSNSDAAEHTPFPSFGCSTCSNAFVASVMADGTYKIVMNNPCNCLDPGCSTDPCAGPAPLTGYYGNDFGFVCTAIATTTTTSTTVTTTTTSTFATTTTSTTSTTATTSPEGPPTTTTTSTTSTSSTTTTTTILTTTTTVVTTTTTIVTTTTTTTIPCIPTGPETGHCNDMIDNDCNGMIDCSDIACQPATCEGGNLNGSSCSTTSSQADCIAEGGTCVCPFLRGDPTYIRFGPAGAGMDEIKSHARVVINGPMLDVKGSEVKWLLTDANGKIFAATLPAGSLSVDQSGRVFNYKNPDAMVHGGIYRVFIRARKVGSSYSYRLQAYGDMSRATNPDMALQFYVGGNPTSAIHAETWQKRSYGWRARGFDR